MAGQVVDDWTWTPLMKDALDHYTWAPMGPGSVRGFNRLKGLPLGKKPLRIIWLTQLQYWRSVVIEALGPSYADMTLMDIQNILCEVDKYLRVQAGQGRPRAKYKPETAF